MNIKPVVFSEPNAVGVAYASIGDHLRFSFTGACADDTEGISKICVDHAAAIFDLPDDDKKLRCQSANGEAYEISVREMKQSLTE